MCKNGVFSAAQTMGRLWVKLLTVYYLIQNRSFASRPFMIKTIQVLPVYYYKNNEIGK